LTGTSAHWSAPTVDGALYDIISILGKRVTLVTFRLVDAAVGKGWGLHVRSWRAPWKGGAFQWVQTHRQTLQPEATGAAAFDTVARERPDALHYPDPSGRAEMVRSAQLLPTSFWSAIAPTPLH
jgi:hypothetical protein